MTTTAAASSAAQDLAERIEGLEALDGIAKPIGKSVRERHPARHAQGRAQRPSRSVTPCIRC